MSGGRRARLLGATLKALALSGASAIRASVALKRPLKGVKLRAREMGVPFKNGRELKKERQRKAAMRLMPRTDVEVSMERPQCGAGDPVFLGPRFTLFRSHF